MLPELLTENKYNRYMRNQSDLFEYSHLIETEYLRDPINVTAANTSFTYQYAVVGQTNE